MSYALNQILASGLVPGAPRIGARRAPVFVPLSLFTGTIGGFWNDMTSADVLTAAATGAASIAAAGDRVGLAFDKSTWEGLLRDAIWAAQPELIRNGDFTSDTEWTKDATVTIDGGVAVFTATPASHSRLYQTDVLSGNTPVRYEMRFEIVTRSAGAFQAMLAFSFDSIGPVESALGVRRAILRVGLSNTRAEVYVTSQATGTVDNVSVREIPGKHASQSTGTARFTWQETHAVLDGTDDNLLSDAVPAVAGTLIFAGAFDAASDVAIGSRPAADGFCYLGTDASGFLAGAIGADGFSTIKGATDIRGLSGVYGLRWDGTAVKLNRNKALDYTGAQNGAVNTSVPLRLGALNNNGSAASYLAGSARHFLFVPRSLSDAEWNSVVDYFS